MRGGRRGGEKLYHRLLDSYVKGLSGSHLTPATALKRGFFSSQIIAILAAILFPVFAKAREKARAASCLSNCKQMGLGLLQYSQDYDERISYCENYLPSTWTNGRWVDRNDGSRLYVYMWLDAILPYTKNEQVMLCPSSNQAFVPLPGRMYPDYVYNGHLANMAMGSITNPASTLWFGDQGYAQGTAPNGSSTYVENYIGGRSGLATTHWCSSWLSKRHNDGGNYCYVDGHVKWHGTNDGSLGQVSGLTALPARSQGMNWDPTR